MLNLKNIEGAVRVAVPGIAQTLFYRSDDPAIQIGFEVGIKLGTRTAHGWVTETLSIGDAERLLEEELAQANLERKNSGPAQLSLGLLGQSPKTKRLKSVISATPVFPAEHLALFNWISEYYGAPLAEVIESALPQRAEDIEEQVCRLTTLLTTEDLAAQIDTLKHRAPLQAKVCSLLQDAGGELPSRVLSDDRTGAGPGARAALSALKKKGLVELAFVKRRSNAEFVAESRPSAIPQLTAGQTAALDSVSHALDRGRFSSFLLYGVTGSGKTEIYLRAIEKVLNSGGNAVVIVPEIALTPQLLDQFHARLNIPLALLHSEVGIGERWRAWKGLLNNDYRVAIGARSAVFAPLAKPSLIIVDEEHESSYKQNDGLRYNARDVAVVRAKLADCPIILGSATPSFESLLNVKRKRYRLIEMPERVTTRALPQIEIIDLRRFSRADMPCENISPPLYTAISETLAADGQVVIFYNRRGFSTYLQCDSCGYTVQCSHCSVTLTFHKKRGRLVCHYCGQTIAPPEYCKFCRDPKFTRVDLDPEQATKKQLDRAQAVGVLSYRGGGTERVVEELAELFPTARIARLDRDSVGKKDSYRRILGSVRSGESNILVGTQMVAKGHDLPGVTLVGIIDADVGLHLPDFRTNEKVFQLVTQAAGRAGRGKEQGRVLVQTREPDHPTIVATATGRFMAFARYQLEYRKELNYPPWGRLLRIVVSSPDRHEAERGAQLIGRTVREMGQRETALRETAAGSSDPAPPVSVLGPVPAPHEKLRGRFRWHLIVKANSARLISAIASRVSRLKHDRKEFKDLRVVVDVDAVDML